MGKLQMSSFWEHCAKMCFIILQAVRNLLTHPASSQSQSYQFETLPSHLLRRASSGDTSASKNVSEMATCLTSQGFGVTCLLTQNQNRLSLFRSEWTGTYFVHPMYSISLANSEHSRFSTCRWTQPAQWTLWIEHMPVVSVFRNIGSFMFDNVASQQLLISIYWCEGGVVRVWHADKKNLQLQLDTYTSNLDD